MFLNRISGSIPKRFTKESQENFLKNLAFLFKSQADLRENPRCIGITQDMFLEESQRDIEEALWNVNEELLKGF